MARSASRKNGERLFRQVLRRLPSSTGLSRRGCPPVQKLAWSGSSSPLVLEHLTPLCHGCLSGQFSQSSCPGTDTARAPDRTLRLTWRVPVEGDLFPRGCRCLEGALVRRCCLGSPVVPQDLFFLRGLLAPEKSLA